jgi:cyclin B
LHDITNVAACRGGYGKSTKLPEVPVQKLADRAKAAIPLARVASGTAAQTASVSSISSVLPVPQPAEGASAASIGGDLEKEQGVAEYVPDIFSHLFNEEVAFMPRPTYMESQVDINAKMRAILIDWLVEVHMKYKLRLETLFLTINLIDRYLMRTPVIRKRLQLIGVVAMFVACKFEEIEPPRIQDFVYITDNAYSKEDIISMECTMLTTLGFKVVAPTPAHLLHRFLSANRCDDRHRQLVQYILELALLDLQMVRHSPSHLVASALLLSNELIGRRLLWPPPMVSQTRHTEHALRACAEELRALLDAAPHYFLQAIRKKFSHERHLSVARMPCLTARREAVH